MQAEHRALNQKELVLHEVSHTVRRVVVMATKRRVQIPDSHTSRGPARPWPPTCLLCGEDDQPGFVGEPSDTESPYIACGGKPARHQRTPVGARS